MVSSDRLVYKLLELVEQKTLRRGGNSMKKIRSIGCLIVLILSVLNLKIALGQGEESLNNDQDVTLEVDGGFLTLMIPAEYQHQTVELTELERYPFSYTFMNEETGIRFTVYSTLHSQKEQSHFLKKLYDKSNRYIVFEDVLIGGYTYIVYTIEQATYDYGFLVRTDNGYSYQFQYALPYDRIQYEISSARASSSSKIGSYMLYSFWFFMVIVIAGLYHGVGLLIYESPALLKIGSPLFFILTLIL